MGSYPLNVTIKKGIVKAARVRKFAMPRVITPFSKLLACSFILDFVLNMVGLW